MYIPMYNVVHLGYSIGARAAGVLRGRYTRETSSPPDTNFVTPLCPVFPHVIPSRLEPPQFSFRHRIANVTPPTTPPARRDMIRKTIITGTLITEFIMYTVKPFFIGFKTYWVRLFEMTIFE